MQNIQYPLSFTFKISTFSNDFIITDADGNTLYFVRQKLFKFIEEVMVYKDESKSEQLYTINANKWIDFSAAYTFTNNLGNIIGSVARKGWASLWKAHYEVLDTNKAPDFIVREENAWIKVADALLGEIPILGIFTGYLFHPSYMLTRANGEEVIRLKKEASFFGRRFTVNKLDELTHDEEERVILSLMMMILLERRRG